MSAGRPTREATEAALLDAAFALLKERGVLSGMTLQEIAERADTSRGLVYHYFGSREELLRAAARRHIDRRSDQLASQDQLPFAERMTGMLATAFEYEDAARLAVTLVLDHDPSIRTLPFRRRVVERLEQDVAEGRLAIEDVPALYSVFVSIIYGFMIMGERFAAEFRCERADLERRVLAVCVGIFSSLERPAEAGPSDSSDPVPTAEGAELERA
jgi:AcrR family transcriptional regulator